MSLIVDNVFYATFIDYNIYFASVIFCDKIFYMILLIYLRMPCVIHFTMFMFIFAIFYMDKVYSKYVGVCFVCVIIIIITIFIRINNYMYMVHISIKHKIIITLKQNNFR